MPRSVASLSHSVLQLVHFIFLPLLHVSHNGNIGILLERRIFCNNTSFFILQGEYHIVMQEPMVYKVKVPGLGIPLSNTFLAKENPIAKPCLITDACP